MIHLQQIATPVADIVAGLCFAVARNFRSNLARGKELEPPVTFQGGVAANAGMVRAFREVFELDEEQLFVPEHYASMGAIGALYYLLDHPEELRRAGNGSAAHSAESGFRGLEALESYLSDPSVDADHLDPLVRPDTVHKKEVCILPEGETPVYLGIDVGSLSTNVVLIDEQHRVVARRYLPTASRPLEAIRRGLSEIGEEVGSRVVVKGAGTTGSGRYLTGDFIGADTIQNEITAQATAAIDYDPTVDTIFEIGGQDSKYISISRGVVVDFEMNKVCAAGTGSFLEEQAEKLGISIVDEFASLALGAAAPARLGDRCTVFMESDLNSHQQKGVAKENLVGGLAYSIALNYIQKVVGNKRVGDHIFFQGGVTNNDAVVSAFQKVTGKRITVPPHFDVTGAIGAAILAQRELADGRPTRFRGFDVSRAPYTFDRFTCKHCSNQCEIRRVRIEGKERPLFYGGRCERWEPPERKGKGQGIPNLFEERLELLLGDFEDKPLAPTADSVDVGRKPTIGIPRGLMVFYQQFPFWRTFFEDLGFRVVLSEPSNRRLVTRSLEALVAETCFPVEVMHGHVLDLLERGVDHVFLPFVVNAKAEPANPTFNWNCPWVQTYPFMIRSAMRDDLRRDRLLTPRLYFRFGAKFLQKDLTAFMKSQFNTEPPIIRRAVTRAVAAQNEFEDAVSERGRQVLADLPPEKEAVVVLGRPYNTGDPELNLHLVEKLINLDVLPVPLDFLPLETADIFEDYPMMYWPNGGRILAGARLIGADDRLHAVFLGNFRCGPDSFLLHYVTEEMRGKPFLQLEVDEHSADAGLITRCEAYLVAAAVRACGMDSTVLPM